MSESPNPSFQRDYAVPLAARLREPRRFLQVLAGPRQVGKTTMVQQVLAEFEGRSVFVSADEPALRDTAWVAAQWERARLVAKDAGKRGAVLVLDEVQKIPAWSEAVKRLWDEDTRARLPLRIVLLGSAPLLVQRGLSESLAGRFEILHLPHWSFAEMRAAFGYSLEQYLYFGGYPGAAPLAALPARCAGGDNHRARLVVAHPRGQTRAPAAIVRAWVSLFGAGALIHQDARPAPRCR